MEKGRILFLYENAAPFVTADLEILGGRFDVTPMECSAGGTFRSLLGPLRGSDASFSWFALGYAARAVLLGKWFRRPSVVVAGGWDVISMPEIGYGAVRSPRGRRRARYVLRQCSLLLTFSDWSRQTIEALSGRRPETVHLGVDVDRFRPAAKEPLVVTVGNVTKENLARKGIETFVRAAALVPDVPFLVVGRQEPEAMEAVRTIAPPNVRFTGRLSDEALRDLLARAKVYVQASHNEGFGLAVAEAMAAGCVPVVTKAGSLPEVVGEIGLFAQIESPEATAEAIRRALESDRGDAAREHVARSFPISRRREHLLELVDGIMRREHGR